MNNQEAQYNVIQYNITSKYSLKNNFWVEWTHLWEYWITDLTEIFQQYIDRIKFCAGHHIPEGMNLTDFGDLMTFLPWHLWFCVKFHGNRCHKLHFTQNHKCHGGKVMRSTKSVRFIPSGIWWPVQNLIPSKYYWNISVKSVI